MNLLRPFNAASVPTEAHTALVLAAFIALVVFQSIALWKGQEFSAAAFGEALGILLGGGGVAAFGQSFLTKARGQLTSQIIGGNIRPDNPDK